MRQTRFLSPIRFTASRKISTAPTDCSVGAVFFYTRACYRFCAAVLPHGIWDVLWASDCSRQGLPLTAEQGDFCAHHRFPVVLSGRIASLTCSKARSTRGRLGRGEAAAPAVRRQARAARRCGPAPYSDEAALLEKYRMPSLRFCRALRHDVHRVPLSKRLRSIQNNTPLYLFRSHDPSHKLQISFFQVMRLCDFTCFRRNRHKANTKPRRRCLRGFHFSRHILLVNSRKYSRFFFSRFGISRL